MDRSRVTQLTRLMVCILAVTSIGITTAKEAEVLPLQLTTIELDNAKIQLAVAGNPIAPPVIFIHGSPGSWSAWINYMQDEDLVGEAFLIAVDRPGFGGSNYGESGLSLARQSELIHQALSKVFPALMPGMFVGHSYGAPVVLQMAADFPDSVRSTLLLAPAIDPDVMRVRWYNQAARLWPVRWFLPGSWKHSNDEMLKLPKELRLLDQQLSSVNVKTTVIQGGKDKLVRPANADYASRALNSAVEVILLKEANHFIPWQQYPLVKEQLLQHLSLAQGQDRAAAH